MVVITRHMQDAIGAINNEYQGPGTWLYKLARGQQMPQLVSESVATVFDTYKEWGILLFRSSQVKLKLRIVLESTEELTVSVDVKMHYTTYPSARIVTFFHEDILWALKFAPHTEAYHAFVAKLQTGNLQDGASEELVQAMQEAAGYTSPHSSFGDVVMGANSNSYLQRKGTFQFDVMSNTPLHKGGFLSSGSTVSFTLPAMYSTPLTCGQAILGSSEASMLMLSDRSSRSSAASTKMFVGDLERETIVRTLDFTKGDVEVSQARICTPSKAAQLSDSPYLLGLDRNRLSMWDIRTQEGIVEWIDGREYGRGYNFKCLATSGEGHVVVGSADGKISLYKAGKLTKAQKIIPGIGKPITAIDITYDSSWILATTDDYLLVIGAVTEGVPRSAFTGPGAQAPLNMRLLRLTPDDEAAAGLAGYAFTNAKFPWVTESNSGSDCERWISASRGSYTVMWNFARVKTSAGATFDDGDYPTFEEYHLCTQGQQPVVDSAFMHHRYAPPGKDTLVVVTPFNVHTRA